MTPLEIPTPEINKVIRPTNEINKDVFSIKLLKLFVLFFIFLIEILVPCTNFFKKNRSIFLLLGINLILYLTKDPGITRPDALRASLEINNLDPNVAKENIRSGSFFIIPLI